MPKTTPKEERPERPLRSSFPTLRGQILTYYFLLACSIGLFIHLSYKDNFTVPDGQYRMKDGTYISITEYDVNTLGPYPKCHEHHGEHLDASTGSWVKNNALNESDPDIVFPVGHPKNKEWRELREKKIAEMAEKNLTLASLLPSLHLLALSFFCVYLGSKHSAWLYLSGGEDDDSMDDGSSVLQDEDAYWFPIMGSIVLFSLFLVYKFVDVDWIKYLFSCYIVIMCMAGLGTNVSQFLAVIRGKDFKPLFNIEFLELAPSIVDIICFACSGFAGYHYIITKNWIINNVFGVSFCLMGIKMIGLSKYQTGAIMLIGLFFYDIFWVFGSKSVFGSNVMVTVAKGVEAPIKLMFPRGQNGCGDLEFSMLGLGDIVVPGLFIAFLAKFDVTRVEKGPLSMCNYLNITMVAYCLSIVTTVVVMLFFNAAQPALLYIVPFILISSMLTAVAFGEVKQLMDFEIFDENEEEEEEEDKKKED